MLRKELKLTEGRSYDAELLEQDAPPDRQVPTARSASSTTGGAYVAGQSDPDYLHIDAQHDRPPAARQGRAGLLRSTRASRSASASIRVKGNYKTQDKVILRDMRFAPGELYNAGELQDAKERLTATRRTSTTSASRPSATTPTTATCWSR